MKLRQNFGGCLQLLQQDIIWIEQIAYLENSTICMQAWKSADTFDILDQWTQEWRGYINALIESHVCITIDEDELIWAPAAHDVYSPKEGYHIIHVVLKPPVLEGWWRSLWKLKVLPRTHLFMWNAIMKKTPIGINLMTRTHFGLTWCVLYQQAEESNEHLFLFCATV